MELAIVGLGHAFEKQMEAIKKFSNFNNIELCDNDVNKIKKYNAKDSYLSIKNENVLIATSPLYHLKIVKDLINNGKRVILEKPVVVSNCELEELMQIATKENYYNSLHFSFGLEIEFFIEHIKKKPKRIYSYISDNYIENNKIKKENISLCGAYLDETINPLSAISRMFGYDVKFVDVIKKYYKNDNYDYYSKSKFIVNKIPVTIEVLWNSEKSQKYIDLIYENCVIRLDSMKQEVIDLKNRDVLFKGKGDRMTNHYIGAFNDYLTNGSNIKKSFKLHKELLKGG